MGRLLQTAAPAAGGRLERGIAGGGGRLSTAAPAAQTKPVEKEGLFTKVLKFGGEVVKDVGRSLLSTAARQVTDPTSAISPLREIDPTGTFANLAMDKLNVPEKIKLPVLGDTSIRYSKDPLVQLGQRGEDVLNVLGGGSTESVFKSVAKTALKDVAETTGKEILKSTAKTALLGAESAGKKISGRMLAKTLLSDAVLGAGYGATSELQNPNATAGSIAKSAAIAAPFGVLAPRVIGAGLKVTGKAVGIFGRVASDFADTAAGKLEGVAGRAEQAAGKLAAERPHYYAQVDKPTQTIIEKAAEKTAKVIRFGQELPGQVTKKLLDRFAPMRTFQLKAEEAGIKPTNNLGDEVQGATYRAAGKAENRLDDYLSLRGEYGDAWQNVKYYSHYLDDLDRLSTGKQIPGGRTTEQVQADIQKTFGSLPAEEQQMIQEGQKRLQGFFDQTLQEAVASGRLSKEGYAQIKAEHPNYVPHDVLDFLDEQASKGLSSFNIKKSGIQAAKGSTREIDDIDNAVVNRLYRQMLLDERNKTTAAVIETGKQMGDVGGFVPLRTAEKVAERKQAVEELAQLRDEAARIKESYGLSNAQDKKIVAKIDDLNKQIDELSQKAITTFTEVEPDETKQLVQRLTTKIDDRAAQRQVAKEQSGMNDLSVILDTKTKERVSVLNQDIRRLEERLASAQKEYDAKAITFAESGERTTGAREQQRLAKAQDDLETALLEKEHILNTGKTIFLPAERQKAKVTFRSENMGPTAKQAIEQMIPKRNAAIEKLKERISLREGKLAEAEANKMDSEKMLDTLLENLQTKKAQMGSIFEELRGLRDITMKKVDMPDGFDVVSYYKNGVREDWLVPEDVAGVLKMIDEDEGKAALTWLNNSVPGKILQAPAKITRKLATGLNPVFALFSNPARDLQTIAITTDMAAKDIANGLAKTIGIKSDDELYRLAREAGALQGSIFREQLKPQEVLANKLYGGGVLNKVTRLDKTIEGAGQTFEEAVRLSVFRYGLGKGMTPKEAAVLARNATVDFGKAGEWVQVANKVIPFLNARVQGFSNLVRSAKEDPTRVTRRLMWTAAYPAAFLNAHNARYQSYQNIPDNERRKYWIIMVGESSGRDAQNHSILLPHYVKVPKGEAQQAVSNTVERILNLGREKYPDTTGQFLTKMFGDISPVSEANLLPAGIQQAIELKTNHSFFRNKPIVPGYVKVEGKSFKSSDIPAQYQATPSTSEVAKYLGQAVGWSPVKIDYVAKTGLLNDLLRGVDLVVDGWDKKNIDTKFGKAAELPFVRTIIGTSEYGQDEKKKQAEQEKVLEKNTKKINRLMNKKAPQAGGASSVGRLNRTLK